MFLVIFCGSALHATAPQDFAVDLAAAVSDTSPCITLSWSQRLQSNITGQKIYRRLKGETSWGTALATLSTTQTSYADPAAVPGVEYEYWMQRTLNISPYSAMGYISAGVNVPATETRGKLLLVVDDTMVAPLAPEIAQLQQDLTADGWTVQQISAPRTGTAVSTKALITAAYNADPTNVKAVYLLGHVPVPYSGYLGPDGHAEHYGAWPADAFYGDMNGTWTDTSQNTTSSYDTRLSNVPGDGKFDQTQIPSLLELEVGRVDLQSMTKAPTSAVSETSLLRRYLRKAHDYRHMLGAYASIPRQSLIRDGWGYFSGENFSMTGWANAFTGAGRPPETPIDEAPDWQWFSPDYAGGKSYLVGHGGGAGGKETCSGLGASVDFGRKPSGVVFPSLFGSNFADWDVANNLMRSVLAGNADGDSLGLTCFWAGRPHWYMHHMGMGETIGYSARITQNSGLTGGGTYSPGGYAQSYVHVALMGDPALRLHMVRPPRKLAATSANGQVVLQWEASPEAGLIGYHVYRAPSVGGPFTRLTGSAQAGAAYTDTSATSGGTFTYLVRTLKLESVPGGTYQNLSVGSATTLTVNDGATAAPPNPTELAISSASSTHPQISWTDNSSDETGFRIERKTNAAGAYAPLATVSANTTAYADSGLVAGNVYFYRVVATGAAGDSSPSNETSFEPVAGFFDFTSTRMKVNKTAGTAAITVARFGGGAGPASVQYATSDAGAVAGTHYAATSGTMNWADGESGAKTINVPITNTAGPQCPRGFRVTLSNPSADTTIATTSYITVLIEDPAASLAAPWSQAILGSLTDSSPAVQAEGMLGDATFGGTGAYNGATSEGGGFLYQTLTGDGVAKVFVPSPAPAQFFGRVALMVRANTGVGSIMAAAVIADSRANSGALFVYRSTTGAAAVATAGTANSLVTPCWLRITRSGNTFTAEASPDDTTWTVLGSTTLASMPTTALWGAFHESESANSSTNMGDYQSAQYQSFSVVGAPPIEWDWNTPAQWPNNVVPTGTRVTRANMTAAGQANLSNTASVGLIVNYTGGYAGTPTGFNELIMANGVTLNINAPNFNLLGLNQAGTPVGNVTMNANTKLNVNSGGALNADGPVQLAVGTANLDVNAGGTLTWGNNESNCSFNMGAGTLNIRGSMSAPSNGGGFVGNRGVAMRGSTVNINGGTAAWNWTSVSEQFNATLNISNNGSLHNFKSANGGSNDGVLKVGTWSNVGSTAAVNISSGGTLTNDREMIIAGSTASSPDNTLKTATVTMTGGAINQGGATTIGYARVGILDIQGGAFTTTGATAADATVNVGGVVAATLQSNERQSGEFKISGGTVTIHNAANSALLNIGNAVKGTLTMSGGTLNVDRLTGTNPATSVIVFSGGTLNSKDTTIANGSVFNVGDGGGTTASLNLTGSGHSFANGLQINSDGAVSLVSNTALADTTAVSIANGGAMTLDFAGNDIVASLTLDGVTQPDGLYGAASHPAIFTGTGRIQVGAVVSGFSTWAYAGGIPGEPATGDFDHDGLTNLMEYALGLDPAVPDNGGHLAHGLVSDTGGDYLSLTYTRPEPAPDGITYTVESCPDLASASWTSTGLVEVSSTVNAGLRTITIRDGVPLSGAARRFMRLRITQP